jgi:predicted phage tail protein
MLSEVEKYLESDERVVEMVFPSRLDPAYLKWFVISLLLVVAGGAGAVVAFYVDFAQSALFWGGLAVVGVGVVLGGIAELRRRFVCTISLTGR